jgi:hypothetical protein
LIGQRWGGTGRALRLADGPIHRDRVAEVPAPPLTRGDVHS